MEPIFFWVLAVGLVVSAIGLVAFRNPVTSAVCLVVTLVMEAALFVTLEAYFLAVVQVIVYAGAVMVLFLFVIMLLDVKEEARQRPPWAKVMWVVAIGGGAVFGVPRIASLFPAAAKTLHWGQGKGGGSAAELGRLLFSSYSPLFLATGVLLLVATVGVVVLCRKDPES
jgi:NADH-quinone oxidoreductase subunit J